MDEYLDQLREAPPVEYTGTPSVDSTLHLARVKGIDEIRAINPELNRWLLLNRLLDPMGRDPIFGEYQMAAEFVIPNGERPAVKKAVEQILQSFKRVKSHVAPKLEHRDGIFILSRKAGPSVNISTEEYQTMKNNRNSYRKANQLSLDGEAAYSSMYNVYSRYQALGLRWGYEKTYYQLLKKSYQVTTHLFSSPMVNLYPRYGSFFPDLDREFNSLGNLFYQLLELEGTVELTGLFLGPFYAPLIERVKKVIEETTKKLRVIVLIEGRAVADPKAEFQRSFREGQLTVLVYQNYDQPFDPQPLVQYFQGAAKETEGEAQEAEKSVYKIAGYDVRYPTPKSRTLPYLTIYEKSVAIGKRAHQFVRGGVPQIDVVSTDLIDIAEAELKEKKMPITIRRKFPDGSYEDHQINKLYDPHY